MIGRIAARARRDDAGFTLVELIVYCVILLVVMTIAGSIFLQIVRAQRDIGDMASANNEAQLTFKELERDVRNAAAIRIADGGKLIVMRTRVASDSNTDAWQCVGYYLDTGNEVLRVTRSSNSTATHNVLAQATSAGIRTAASAWPVARDGFMAVGTTRPFGTIDGSFVYPGSVNLRLAADSENGHDPVKLTKTVALRPQGSASLDCM